MSGKSALEQQKHTKLYWWYLGGKRKRESTRRKQYGEGTKCIKVRNNNTWQQSVCLPFSLLRPNQLSLLELRIQFTHVRSRKVQSDPAHQKIQHLDTHTHTRAQEAFYLCHSGNDCWVPLFVCSLSSLLFSHHQEDRDPANHQPPSSFLLSLGINIARKL